jgi:hypothetical protein
MMSRLSRLAGAATVLLALALPGAAAQAATYYPSGPQGNVPRSTVSDGGWSVCYDGNYFDHVSLNVILSSCSGPYLMMAGTAVGSPNYQLLAAAPRADVLHEAGTVPDGSLLSNGTKWYFNTNWSWGFGPNGDTINRVSCDYNSGIQTNPTLHLCWHTTNNALNVGYRMGNVADTANWARYVLQATGIAAAVGSPDPLVFGTQAEDTVSAVSTVSFNITGTAGSPVGALTVAGTDKHDFFKRDDDCPAVVPVSGAATCTAEVRFIPSAVGIRTATLGFAIATSAVTLQGTGGAPPTGPTDPTGPADGPADQDSTDDAKGDGGRRGVRLAARKVHCSIRSRTHGARMLCRFDHRTGLKWLVQLRDRHGALATEHGNGTHTMSFRSERKPRGTMQALVIKGVRTESLK